MDRRLHYMYSFSDKAIVKDVLGPFSFKFRNSGVDRQ